MLLRFPDRTITIADNDQRAIDIKAGHAYSLVNGELNVAPDVIKPNFTDLLAKTAEATASAAEIQLILNILLQNHVNNGRI